MRLYAGYARQFDFFDPFADIIAPLPLAKQHRICGPSDFACESPKRLLYGDVTRSQAIDYSLGEFMSEVLRVAHTPTPRILKLLTLLKATLVTYKNPYVLDVNLGDLTLRNSS